MIVKSNTKISEQLREIYMYNVSCLYLLGFSTQNILMLNIEPLIGFQHCFSGHWFDNLESKQYQNTSILNSITY